MPSLSNTISGVSEVRYWKELSRTIQTAGIGWKACRRRNRVPSRSFSTLNRAESSYPVKSNRLLIKNGPSVPQRGEHRSDVTTGKPLAGLLQVTHAERQSLIGSAGRRRSYIGRRCKNIVVAGWEIRPLTSSRRSP